MLIWPLCKYLIYGCVYVRISSADALQGCHFEMKKRIIYEREIYTKEKYKWEAIYCDGKDTHFYTCDILLTKHFKYCTAFQCPTKTVLIVQHLTAACLFDLFDNYNCKMLLGLVKLPGKDFKTVQSLEYYAIYNGCLVVWMRSWLHLFIFSAHQMYFCICKPVICPCPLRQAAPIRGKAL